MFKIAIIGRPNVGKSTLFNKLAGRKLAITDNMPGVTRDRREAKGKLGPLEFMVIDTAGLENEIDDKSLEKRMFEQTELAIADADLCLLVIDGKSGVNNQDFHFSKWIKKSGKKTVLIINKCENLAEGYFDKEYYKLGFKDHVAISAEHKLGFGELYEAIAPEIEKYQELYADQLDEDEGEKPLQVAIIGRPNAGKSTFLNKILKEDRLITGPEAGITRDSISVNYTHKDQQITFIDTAGIRKKSNINQDLEKFSIADSFHALRFSQIVVLLIDATSLLDKQDVALAGQVLKEGRGLIFAINKIDLVKGDKEKFLKEVRKQINSLLPGIEGSAIVGISAQNGNNIDKVLDYVLGTYEQWQTQISTRELNDWLRMAEMKNPPKLNKGRQVKLKYITQIKKRPPTFAVFTNHIKPLKGSYERYLINLLRGSFDLDLTPIRLVLKKSDNPYAGIKEKKFSKKTKK